MNRKRSETIIALLILTVLSGTIAISPSVARAHATEANYWFLEGSKHVNLGEFEKAIECFEKVLELDPKNASAWNEMGYAYDELGDFRKGIECYDEGLEIDPNYTVLWSNKGYALDRLGEHSEALECLERALEIDPYYTDALVIKSGVHIDLEEYQEALECYNRIAAIFPADPTVMLRMAEALERLGDVEEAQYWQDRATRTGIPGEAVTIADEATYYEDIGDFERALEFYNESLELDPRNAVTWNNKALCHIELGDIQEAIKAFDTALEIAPNYRVALTCKGLAHTKIGENEEALSLYTRAIEIDPYYPPAWINLGKLLRKTGQEDEAKICFSKAREMIVPKQYTAYSKYGLSFEYPASMIITEQGFEFTVATDNSGIVIGAPQINGDFEEIWIMWQYDPEMDFESWRQISEDMSEEWIIESAEENIMIIKHEPFEIEATTKTGHQMLIRCYAITSEGEICYRRSAIWYCDNTKRLFLFDYTTIEEDTLHILQRYLDSFVAHAATQIVKIGVTASSTANMETLVPLIDIVQEDIDEYVNSQGYDIVFEFIIKNNQGTAAIALENTQEFKAMGIDLIIGHGWSSQCGASLPYVNENNMLLLSSSTTAPTLSIANDRLFRVAIPDVYQALAIAEMWNTWGTKAVLTIHREDAWGDGIWNVLEPLWEPNGIEDLGRIRYAGEMTEFSSYLAQANDIIQDALTRYDITEIGLQGFWFEESRTIQTQAADYPNLMGIIWMSTESGGCDQLMLNEAGEYAVQTRHFSALASVDNSHPDWNDFVDRYYSKTESLPSWYTVAQYDACWLLVKTILETGSTDASVIAEALIPYSATCAGLTGNLALDYAGDRLPQTFDIWGFYEDLDEGKYSFRKLGEYYSTIGEVNWDDSALLEYAGLVRPGFSEGPSTSSISCLLSTASVLVGDDITVSGTIVPTISNAFVTLTYTKPDGSIITNSVETDQEGAYSTEITPDQIGVWRVRVSWEGDSSLLGSNSEAVDFTVARAREAIQLTEIYSRFGFSFKYPKGMVLSEQGVLEATATDSSGAVVGESKDHVIAVSWIKTLQYDLESAVEGGLTGTEGTEGVSNFVRGDRGESTVKGHIVIYRFFTATMGGEKTRGIVSAWYCDDSTRLYSTSVISLEAGPEVFPLFEAYLESFYCHEVAKMPSSISSSISPSKAKVGETTDVSGSITPARGEVTVTLTYQKPDGSSFTRTVTTDSEGSYSDSYEPTETGSWNVEASWEGDPGYEGASSQQIAFTVEEKEAPEEDKKGCIIATATYGSELSPEVQFLRGFRDNTVLNTFAGSSFMTVFNTWYYSFSPRVASAIAANEALRGFMKILLYPLIGILRLAANTHSLLSFNQELAVVMSGLVASLLIGVIYFSPFTIISLITMRRLRRTWGKTRLHRLLVVSWLTSVILLLLGVISALSNVMMVASVMFVLINLSTSAIVTATAVLRGFSFLRLSS